jgi:hypothetical protein
MNNISTTALKVVLVLFGFYGLFLALDFGPGGFKTLGLQGSTDFFQVTDAARYGVQDSNFRFVGGMLAAAGALMIFSVTNLQKYQPVLNTLLGVIFVGGLMRFASGDFVVLSSPEVLSALAGEIVLTAVLFVWLGRVVKTASYERHPEGV